MVGKSPEIIWALEDAAILGSGLKEVLRRKYTLEVFRKLDAMSTRLKGAALKHAGPGLIIAEAPLENEGMSAFLDDPIPVKPPVMIISGCNDFHAISSCLEAGAVDYLLKPVDPNLLLAKIGVLFGSARSSSVRLSMGLEFDVFTHVVRGGTGVSVKLTRKEFQLLSMLEKAYPKGVAPADLKKQLWGHLSGGSKALDVHLFKLRRKLMPLGITAKFGEDDAHILVKSVDEPVTELSRELKAELTPCIK